MSAREILAEILAERARQDAKWGEQNHAPYKWLAILGEELGECCRAALESDYASAEHDQTAHLQDMRAELVQVAAVAVAAIESLDRNELR